MPAGVARERTLEEQAAIKNLADARTASACMVERARIVLRLRRRLVRSQTCFRRRLMP